jgi:hypothetical protein
MTMSTVSWKHIMESCCDPSSLMEWFPNGCSFCSIDRSWNAWLCLINTSENPSGMPNQLGSYPSIQACQFNIQIQSSRHICWSQVVRFIFALLWLWNVLHPHQQSICVFIIPFVADLSVDNMRRNWTE